MCDKCSIRNETKPLCFISKCDKCEYKDKCENVVTNRMEDFNNAFAKIKYPNYY